MSDLIDLIGKVGTIYICGNGGSASTAEHFATDLVKKGYKAIALSSNSSLITMIANDYGYENIFSKQLQVFADSEDLLITISCSGKSDNILNAHKEARWIGMSVYQFETFGKIRDYGKLEDKHLKMAHEIAKELKIYV